MRRLGKIGNSLPGGSGKKCLKTLNLAGRQDVTVGPRNQTTAGLTVPPSNKSREFDIRDELTG
jgi:hypothetical protein